MKPILVFMIFVAAARGRQSDECDSLLNAGDVYYGEFMNTKALSAYKEAYEACPNSYEALYKTTRACNDVGEESGSDGAAGYFQAALEYAESMRNRYPDSLQSYFMKAAAAGNLARLRGGQTKVELSRAVYNNVRRAIDFDSSYAPAWVILGAYYREVATANSFLKAIARSFLGGLPDGTLQDSERALNRAVSLEPENLYAHLELAKTCTVMGDDRQAAMHLRKVKDLPIQTHQGKAMKREAERMLERMSRGSDQG